MTNTKARRLIAATIAVTVLAVPASAQAKPNPYERSTLKAIHVKQTWKKFDSKVRINKMALRARPYGTG